ncbi:putative methyltransferase-domain-containing protein [Boeremia exigua]|uniref:putative methyltransferase-domain-containing protein n=1 Tax=Boeremia exigua TaxID=749465 RepID=UPI001E8CC2F0|nr:putative methyltransferase-domain-containing protein [Boeremia exigua]KAH6622392.1 putative methyltransferase-domain-containing protein [Boeremia exigua]
MAVKKRQKALASGRPPINKPKERMTAQRSRTIIRTHHRLHKQLAAAEKNKDSKQAATLRDEIEKNGGITMYQAASKQGQASDRGGDSSRLLVQWLVELGVIDRKSRGKSSVQKPLRCLEVGALSTTNEISKFPNAIEMTRIDLNSQGPGIEKQNFMERPLPSSDQERFDIFSLSLVLNYVPDAPGRGAMLQRIPTFLRTTGSSGLPLLFFVLPLPCIDNSRYIDEPRLLDIMKSLGFGLVKKKMTAKLCYYLLRWIGPVDRRSFEKRQIRNKPGMNNFSIVVDSPRTYEEASAQDGPDLVLGALTYPHLESQTERFDDEPANGET